MSTSRPAQSLSRSSQGLDERDRPAPTAETDEAPAARRAARDAATASPGPASAGLRAEACLKSGATVRDVLFGAIRSGDADACARIVNDEAADPRVDPDRPRRTPAAILREVGEACVHGVSPLYYAAEYGRADICQLLVAWGASPLEASLGGTALHAAAWSNHPAVCCALLDCGARVDATTPRFGKTALHVAAQRGHGEVCAVLVSRGASHAVALDGTTPLYAAASEGHAAVCALLLERGATHAPSPGGETPLHAAAEGRHLLACQALLARGATHAPTERGSTPICVAVRRRSASYQPSCRAAQPDKGDCLAVVQLLVDDYMAKERAGGYPPGRLVDDAIDCFRACAALFPLQGGAIAQLLARFCCHAFRDAASLAGLLRAAVAAGRADLIELVCELRPEAATQFRLPDLLPVRTLPDLVLAVRVAGGALGPDAAARRGSRRAALHRAVSERWACGDFGMGFSVTGAGLLLLEAVAALVGHSAFQPDLDSVPPGSRGLVLAAVHRGRTVGACLRAQPWSLLPWWAWREVLQFMYGLPRSWTVDFMTPLTRTDRHE